MRAAPRGASPPVPKMLKPRDNHHRLEQHLVALGQGHTLIPKVCLRSSMPSQRGHRANHPRGCASGRHRDANKLQVHKSCQHEVCHIKQEEREENICVCSRDEGSRPGHDTRRHHTTEGPPGLISRPGRPAQDHQGGRATYRQRLGNQSGVRAKYCEIHRTRSHSNCGA